VKLKANGYQPITAMDGSEAVKIARHERPDLILLDISFPPDVGHGGGVAWDGFLIMDWLHRLEEAKNIPIIIITGGDESKLKDRSFAAGAVGFFHKPINNDELLIMIRKTLGETPESANPSVPGPA
jgi:CheY-like chemotaxis protein